MWLRKSAIRLQSCTVAKELTASSVSQTALPRIKLSHSSRSALLSLQSLNRRLLYPIDEKKSTAASLSDETTNQSVGDIRKDRKINKTQGVGQNLIQQQCQQLSLENRYISVNKSNRPFTASFHSNGLVATTVDDNASSLSRKNGSNDDGGYVSDLVVVLDMDECLIHSQFLNGEDEEYRQYEKERSAMMEKDTAPSSNNGCETFQVSLLNSDGKPGNNEYVHVHCRPHLQQFLSLVSSRYETHVCTAAMEVYARPVLEYLDADGTYFGSRIYYRESCSLHPEWGVYVKNLSHFLPITFNPARTVLVDNNPFSFLSNPSNGILVSNFYDDPKDDTLQAVYELLQELEHVPDVRPILEKRFRLKETLDQVLSASHHDHDKDHRSSGTNDVGPSW